MPVPFLKSRIVFGMCTMAVDCSRGALSLASRSQTVHIFHLSLNPESHSGPVLSFAAVTMSALQVPRKVDVDRNSYMSASEQGENVIEHTEFEII